MSNLDSPNNLSMYKVCHLLKEQAIKFGQTSYLYAVLSKKECNHPFPIGKISQKLSMKITEIDIDSQDELGSYEEDYVLDDVSIAVRDYVKAYPIPQG